jgi:hypothetical protein
MLGHLRIQASLLAVVLFTGAASALAQDAGSDQLFVCSSSDGSVRRIDAAAVCNPGEQRVALAVARPDKSGSDLARNLVLLLATAVTSGLLVPYVLGRIDHRRSENQRERETQVARESKVIDAQVRLLDSLSRVLWRWRYLVMKVTYYGSRSDGQRYEVACQEYDTGVWDVLNRFRLEVSRSQRLASEAVHGKLLEFYQLMVDTDIRVREIQESDRDPVKMAIAHSDLNHEVFNDVTARIDGILNDAAHEMGLSGATPARRG